MKTLKVISAEFKKSLSRVGLFVISALLAFAIVFAAISFKPEKREPSSFLTLNGQTATAIFEDFKTERVKSVIDKESDDIRQYVHNYDNTDIQKNEILNKYTIMVGSMSDYHHIVGTGVNTKKNEIKEQVYKDIESLKSCIDEIVKLGENNIIKLLIKDKSYSALQIKFAEIMSVLGATSITNEQHIFNDNECQKFKSYIDKQIKEFNYPTIKPTTTVRLHTTIYNNIKDKQAGQISYVEDLLKDITVENDKSITYITKVAAALNTYYQYSNLYINLSTTTIKNELVEKYSNKEINEFKYFASYNKYIETENLAKLEYYYKNNTFADDYANALSFSAISNVGSEASAYDFMFYALEIFSFIIILFAIYVAATSIAGEMSSGTLKLYAIKPVSRSKIFFGKLLFVVLASLILILFSAIISFIVGYFIYGISSASILMLFNATTIVTIHPILYMLIYLASLLIKVTVFVCIGMLLSTIFKNGTFPAIIGILIFFISIVLGILLPNSIALLFIPFANISLFPFFGNMGFVSGSSTISQIFATVANQPASIILTCCSIVGIILLCTTIGLIIFKKRDIA